MGLAAAKCTNCGASLQVDNSKEAGICLHCGTAFITEKVINNYNTFVTQNVTKHVYGAEGKDVEELLEEGSKLLDAGQVAKAREKFIKAIDVDPQNWEAWANYALVGGDPAIKGKFPQIAAFETAYKFAKEEFEKDIVIDMICDVAEQSHPFGSNGPHGTHFAKMARDFDRDLNRDYWRTYYVHGLHNQDFTIGYFRDNKYDALARAYEIAVNEGNQEAMAIIKRATKNPITIQTINFIDAGGDRKTAEQSQIWASQGLCRYCGGQIGGVFTKKCKSCGKQ